MPTLPMTELDPLSRWTYKVRLGRARRWTATIYLDVAYERDDLGRAHHALYMTLYLPVPPGDCHPYATCRIWERDPHIAEPLEVHMPQPRSNADLLADAQRAQARVLLADLWLSGELRRLWRKVMC